MRMVRWDQKLRDFLDMVEQNQVRINRRYQRSGKVWPLNAKSYLIETVIQGLVLPPFMVYAVPGRNSRTGYVEIVDGQQRTAALLAFRKGEFRLSDAVDSKRLRRKTYSMLSQSDRRSFDRYELKINRLEQATSSNVREVFRRINYYTSPLNPEEQRHAQFQGKFKWFIQRQRESFENAFKLSGVLTEKRIERMGDAKLLSEIVHALVHGISTTNARSLKGLYRDYDHEFRLARAVGNRLVSARKVFAKWRRLPGRIARNYQAYSLLLALIHAQRRAAALGRHLVRSGSVKGPEIVLRNLQVLAAVLEHETEKDVPAKYRSFYQASQKGTNVRARRVTRFRWYYGALTRQRV